MRAWSGARPLARSPRRLCGGGVCRATRSRSGERCAHIRLKQRLGEVALCVGPTLAEPQLHVDMWGVGMQPHAIFVQI